MKLHTLAAALGIVLTGCTGVTSSIGQGAYALAAALDTAEKLAAAYEQSPAANPSVIAQIKALDARAYAAVQPLAANGDNVTADELAGAQAAMTAFSQYLAQHGGK
jgi:glutathione S-transferase